jgi:protease-4
VATGRELSPAEVEDVGRGRVWTGQQAMQNGLVDQLGGFFAAIDVAQEEAGILLSDKVELRFYPRKTPLLSRFMDLFALRVAGEAVPWWSTLRRNLVAYDFRPGSILTLMPQQIEIR